MSRMFLILPCFFSVASVKYASLNLLKANNVITEFQSMHHIMRRRIHINYTV